MQQKNQYSTTLVSIVGPTAVGKTSLAIALAKHWDTEIVNCDARQVYRHLDIGTAKPNQEELAAAKHHVIAILAPHIPYNAQQYAKDAEHILKEIFSRKNIAIAVGGSTLYAQSLWYGMDPMPEIDPKVRETLNALFDSQGIKPLQEELATVDPETWAVIDRQNHARIIRALEVYRSSGKPISFFRKGEKEQRPWENKAFCLNLEPRAKLYDRINRRVDAMISQGLVAETKALLDAGVQASSPGFKSIGYQELMPYFEGKTSLENATELIKRNSRRYAKRQLTWWRREKQIHWLEAEKPLEELVSEVSRSVFG
jgi:tRNA dimethylallyltransferase